MDTPSPAKKKAPAEKTSQVQKMPAKRQKSLAHLSSPEIERLEGLISAIQSSGIEEFTEYIRSPWRMLWPNFVAGIARGFGALLGVALVLAGIGWVFAITIDLPLIGKKLEPYVTKMQSDLNKYLEQSNYTDEFENLENTLRAIERNTAPKP